MTKADKGWAATEADFRSNVFMLVLIGFVKLDSCFTCLRSRTREPSFVTGS